MTTTWFQNLKKQAGKLKDVVSSGNIPEVLSPLRSGMLAGKRQQADPAVFPLLEELFASAQPPWLAGRLSLPTGSKQNNSILSEDSEAADEQEEIRKALISLSDLASARENHEVIGRHLPDMFRWLRALISRGDDANSNSLSSSSSDKETLHLLLQILHAIILFDKNTENRANNYVELLNTEAFFSENKDGETIVDNIAVLFDLLSEPSFHVRYESLQLLQTLISNGKLSELQERTLQARTGIPRLMDLFFEEREAIRNELLLLLIELTKHQNSELQKIIAFQGCFERVFEIIEAEIQASNGENRGSIVIADCLQLTRNLLFSNLSNQNYFSETGCLSRLVPLLELTGQSDVWILTDDQVNVLILALDIVSILVSNKASSTSASLPSSTSSTNLSTSTGVSAHWASTLLKLVAILALSGINSPVVRTKALYTLGSLLRGNSANSSALPSISISPSGALSIVSAGSLAAKGQSRAQAPTALFRLLTIALHSRDISERIAAVSTFSSYLYRNPEGQIYLASTLNPPPSSIRADGGITTPVESEDDDNQSIGGRICKAILTGDYLQSWFASVILCDILNSNLVCKELALHIPIYYAGKGVQDASQKDQTLMHRVLQLLVQSRFVNEDSIKVGLIRLLCIWLDDCPKAVKVFREASNYIPLLVELINQQSSSILIPTSPSYSPVKAAHSDAVSLHLQGLCALLLGLCLVQTLNSDEEDSEKKAASLHNIIIHRISKEKFVQRLDAVRKSASFISAEQDKPVETLDSITETLEMMYYTYEFTILFKEVYGQVIQLLKLPPGTKPPSLASARQSAIPTNSESYQDLVVQSYKNIIREQDFTINQLRKQLAESNGTRLFTETQQSHQQQEQQQLSPDVLSKLLQLAESLFASYSELGTITLAKHEEVELAKTASPEVYDVVQAEATKLQNLFDMLQLSISQVQALISLPEQQQATGPETLPRVQSLPTSEQALPVMEPPMSLVSPSQPTLSPPRTPPPNNSHNTRPDNQHFSPTPYHDAGAEAQSTPPPFEQGSPIQAPTPQAIHSVASLFATPAPTTSSSTPQAIHSVASLFATPAPPVSVSPVSAAILPTSSSPVASTTQPNVPSNTFDVAALFSSTTPFDINSMGSPSHHTPSDTSISSIPSTTSSSTTGSISSIPSFDVASLFGSPSQPNKGVFDQQSQVSSPTVSHAENSSSAPNLVPAPSTSAAPTVSEIPAPSPVSEALKIYEDVFAKSLEGDSFDAALSSFNAFVEWTSTSGAPSTFPNRSKYSELILEKLQPLTTKLSTLEENSDNVLNCCKLLSLLGCKDDALKNYQTYIEAIVCKEVLISSDYDFSASDDFAIWNQFLSQCTGDSSVTVLSQLFDSIAGNIDEQRSLAEEKLFNSKTEAGSSFANVIRHIKAWSDASATTLVTNFTNQHQVLEAVVAVKQRQHEPSVAASHPMIQDSRVLHQLLEKMTIISRCSRIYEQFIVRKLSENEPNTPLQTIQAQVQVPVSIQELIFHYVALEEYFIIDNTSRALQIKDISPDNNTFLMVDHVFYILQRALSRSFSLSRINAVSNIVNLINNHLSIDFRTALQQLLLQYSCVASSDSSRKWIDFNHLAGHAAALNSVETSISYLSNIHQYIEEHCAKTFFDVKTQIDKIKISSEQLKNETLQIYTSLLQNELSVFASALVGSHIQPLLQVFVSTNYVLAEAQFAEYEVNDPFVGQFIYTVGQQLQQFRQYMNEQVIGSFLLLVVKDLSVVLEQAVLQKRFNLLGGLQWSKDLLAISTFFSTLEQIDTAAIASSLLRLNQISTLLTFERASDVESMNQWSLGVNEIRMILSHRVEFTGEEIARLKLTL